jgi:uncharacterized membrane protein YsdA (DUF1294 family)
MDPGWLFVFGLFNAVATLGYAYIATYIIKVKKEKCKCAQDWRQNVMFYLAIAGACNGTWLAYQFAIGKTQSTYSKYLFMLVTACYLLIAYSYIDLINTRECSCSKDLHIVFLYLVKFVNSLLLTYGLAFIVFMIGAAFVVHKVST